MNDNDKINSMISLSSNVTLKQPSFKDWFTRGHQKIYTFNLAAKLFVEYEYDAVEAINKAKNFVDTFYDEVVNYNKDET